MNKVFLGLILAVCVLGLALVMLNDRLGRKPEPRPQAETSQPEPSLAESAAAARARELAEAAAALAPPAPRMPEAGGAETRMPVAQAEPQPIAEPTPRVEPRPLPGPAPVEKPEPQPIARPEPKPVEPKVAAKPAARPAEQKPATKPEPKPAAEKPGAEEKPKPKAEEKPKPKAEEKPKPKAEEKPKPKAEEKPRAQTAGERNIERFVVFVRDKGATIRVGGNAKMGYSSMTLENPSRVVLDVAGDWKFPAAPGIPKNDLVSAVRVGQNGDKTRVVIDLKTKPRRVVLVPFKGGDGVDVRVDQ